MTEPHSETRGIWGAIAAAEPRTELAQGLVSELHDGLTTLDDLPPAVTFFGGARITPDDPYYAQAHAMGEILAHRNVAPRTGAGPGIMAAVPEGFRAATNQNGDPLPHHTPGKGPQPLTQGFNIVLPFEQSINPAIDVSLELLHFPTRKLMLYKNCLGLVIFPGGFGTLDELLEVWRLKSAGNLNYPVVLYGKEFWKPLEAALHVACDACESSLLPEDLLSLLVCTDDPEEAVDLILDPDQPPTIHEPLMNLGTRIARELIEGLNYLEHLPTAVTFLGGSRFAEDDAFGRLAEEIAFHLGTHDIPTRAAGPGTLSVALARGGHRGSPFLPQQAFGMRRADARNLYGADRVHLVSDRLTHKVLLTEGSRAVIALPGGLGTLDELFSVLCQLQTLKVSSRPIVLVGSSYWNPILDTLRAVMLDGPRQTIGPGDLNLVSITDDPQEAAELALAPPPVATPRGH